MITYIEGNILESRVDALVNTVNTVGVMGKGLALQFKKEFPHNFKIYQQACKNKSFDIGNLIVTEEESLLYGKKIIIDLPTKTDWRKPSEYNYIDTGLKQLASVINERQIKSIAIPSLGTGHGGLEWNKVKELIESNLNGIESDIQVYLPNAVIKEAMKEERAKLTPARAMLLAVLFDLAKSGEFVSEFAAEKVAYFLQRFGAKSEFKLTFEPNFYGPYSGKVRRVLYYLNGNYITGYSAMDKKPFEELGIMMDTEEDVLAYLSQESNLAFLDIVNKTKNFLSGFYSAFGLELLSTIDFLSVKFKTKNLDEILNRLHGWSDRKRTLFSNEKFVEQAIAKLEGHNL
ncbi:type II toxin-antitoxin system antitoxin DNA ADP-ribosyl glycohydrolase DarG [Mucilaginibacter sp. P25]|uniref:O-acetyl-ADP-ribose deacetylase (Regulator of RNase III), contains Macro domain n=1 Tax=Mucilaginibacter gossypii TaxID=551996 RepID=A0A1G8I2M3_9SPHI|nr:macro domain-containing protein [Mucilaginibacter gossypii]SDI13117.1 O-acetyl-ADP-ribose deacetylase (regulator of RNase III), contains Macro domain [Mucilaginibacter gossypii]